MIEGNSELDGMGGCLSWPKIWRKKEVHHLTLISSLLCKSFGSTPRQTTRWTCTNWLVHPRRSESSCPQPAHHIYGTLDFNPVIDEQCFDMIEELKMSGRKLVMETDLFSCLHISGVAFRIDRGAVNHHFLPQGVLLGAVFGEVRIWLVLDALLLDRGWARKTKDLLKLCNM